MIELSEGLKSLYIKTAKKLKGNEKREFMAEVVKGLGIGGQSLAERELGWNRRTIRKGMGELQNGQPFIDGRQRSGRKRVEAKLPNLLVVQDVSLGAIKFKQPKPSPDTSIERASP